MRSPRFLSLLAAVLGLGLVLPGCGNDDAFTSSDTDGSTPAGGQITVGGADFTEMNIMIEMYRLLLEDAGYEVDTKQAKDREIYAKALERGEIDVVPEYAATFAEYLNVRANGPAATEEAPIATNDAQETVEAARPLAEDLGLRILEPAEAADQNGFAVAQSYAEENDLETLSDLGEAVDEPIVLAATEECPDRPFCAPGLEDTYGIEIGKILPLGFGAPQTKEAVQDGEAQLGLVGTTDGTLGQFDLKLLEDDKNVQLADNLVPVVNAETAGDQQIAETLNQLSETLTTEDLTTLNAQVDAERQKPEDVARQYLEDKGLLDE